MTSIHLGLQIAIHMFGFAIVSGHFVSFFNRTFLSVRLLPKIGLAYFFAILAAALLFEGSVALIIHFVAFFLVPIGFSAVQRAQVNAILCAIPNWLSLCELQQKMGVSFKTAIAIATKNEHGWRLAFAHQLVYYLEFGGTLNMTDAVIGHPIIKLFFERARMIHLARNNQLERLAEFSRLIKNTIEFRHKSSQLLLQSRIQVAVILGLQAVLATVAIRLVGFSELKLVIMSSFLLTISGAILCLRMGRRMKWSY